MTPHHCYIDGGAAVVCLCVRGVDHDEDKFDVPLEDDDDD